MASPESSGRGLSPAACQEANLAFDAPFVDSGAASPMSGDERDPFRRLLDCKENSVATFMSSQASTELLDGLPSRSTWSAQMPQALLFPANKPSSRADAIVLDRWISQSLSGYAQRSVSTRLDDEDMSRAVEELVPILSIGLHEIARQVTQHCVERGVVLEKIWRTYVDLFQKALSGIRRSLRKHKERTRRVEVELERVTREVELLHRKHPQQIDRLTSTLRGKFTQRSEDLQDQLQHLRAENEQLTKDYRALSSSASAWFPNFDLYKTSNFKRALERAIPEQAAAATPEAQLAADFLRILSTLSVETRRRVGYYISSLLGLRTARTMPDTAEALTECRDHNKWKIEQLEARVQELRAMKAKSQHAADPPA